MGDLDYPHVLTSAEVEKMHDPSSSTMDIRTVDQIEYDGTAPFVIILSSNDERNIPYKEEYDRNSNMIFMDTPPNWSDIGREFYSEDDVERFLTYWDVKEYLILNTSD